MNLASGTKLGPYDIVSLLGAGGMGEVYRARDSRLKREVAIKVLPQALSLDADRLRRFEQEALATAALNHPNILAVFDIGTIEGWPNGLRPSPAPTRHCRPRPTAPRQGWSWERRDTCRRAGAGRRAGSTL